MIARASFRHFRHHPWQLLLLLLGISLGIAVVAAIEITTDSARHSFREAQLQIYGRATHHIQAQQPIPEALYVSQRREHSHWQSAPVISSLVKTTRGENLLLQLIGVDPLREQDFRNQLGRISGGDVGFSDLQTSPAAVMARSTAAEIGVRLHEQLPLITANGKQTVTLAGFLEDDGDPRLQQLLLMDIGQAQQVLGMDGYLSHIDLILDADEVAAVRAWLPDGVQLEATEAALSERAQLASALYFNLQALGLLALVVGLFLVFSSVSFSLSQRRPIFAQLRTLGLTVNELYRYLAMELLLIAAVGTVAGLLMGIALAQLLLGVMLNTLSDLYVASSLSLLFLNPLTLGKLVLMGVGGCMLAAWKPCQQLAHVPPTSLQQRYLQERTALQQSRLLARYGVPGLMLIAWVMMLWHGSGLWGAFAGIAALLLAGAWMMPMALNGLSHLLERQLSGTQLALRKPVLLMLIRDNRRNLSRTGIAAMALMIAISTTVGIGGMVSSFRDAVQLWLAERLNADLYVSQTRVLPGVRTPLPPEFIADVAALEGIEAVATLRRTQQSVGGRPVSVYASELPIPMRSAYQFVSGDRDVIWQRMAQPDSVLISEPLANRMGLHAGDQLPVPTNSGEREFIVVGVYYDYGSDNGRILMPAATFTRYWSEPPYGLTLYLADSARLDDIVQAIRERWGGALDLSLQRSSVLLQRSVEVFNRTFVITDVLRLLALVVAFVGILSSLLAIQLERQEEVSLLKAVGLNRLELVSLLLGQSLLLGFGAGVLAIPVGELLAWGLTHVVQLRAFGWSIPYQPDLANWLTALGLSVSAAGLASIYPAWRFAHQQGIRRWE
ncbi:ABC transporter permease [Pontibacterium granulatum]|uniref:ABC transporter permease n=1 Tax=Pontibacterium granulatum TaxID=2036029 RepID=UPI00249A4D20|nr:ABC transporter permease [Pontibacterium granulatum]MDI3324466.1 ABC transporter permease [Pontibacterium granulatum]